MCQGAGQAWQLHIMIRSPHELCQSRNAYLVWCNRNVSQIDRANTSEQIGASAVSISEFIQMTGERVVKVHAVKQAESAVLNGVEV